MTDNKTFRVEIVIPFTVDEVTSVEEAEAYGEYLANAHGIADNVKYFEVRAIEEGK